MKKTAAIAALVLAFAVSGCSTASANAAVKPAPAATLYEAVWSQWDGAERPTERWIDTAATLVCKQIIGGIDPRVVMDDPANNEVVVAASERFVCEIDR